MDDAWKFFEQTGLPQAYCLYVRRKQREDLRHVSDGTRTDHPQRGL